MGFRCRTGNKPACRAASGCLLPGAAHSVFSASRPGAPLLAGCERINTARRERDPFLTWGKRRRPRVWLTRRHGSCSTKLSTQRITGELVDSKVLLKGAYSAD